MTYMDVLCKMLRRERSFGHGIVRNGLYYDDEVTKKGHAVLSHGSYEQQMWMWHLFYDILHKGIFRPSFSFS